jgi:hypothetical protein
MRTPDERKRARRHLQCVEKGFRAKGDDTQADLAKVLLDYEDWLEGKPSQFGENMRKWDEIDRVSGRSMN